jgi:hypothetical protein
MLEFSLQAALLRASVKNSGEQRNKALGCASRLNNLSDENLSLAELEEITMVAAIYGCQAFIGDGEADAAQM